MATFKLTAKQSQALDAADPAEMTTEQLILVVAAHASNEQRAEQAYAKIAKNYRLTGESQTTRVTEVARKITMLAYASTGVTVLAESMAGRDPGQDAANRDEWLMARAVRAGLVRAIKSTKKVDDSDAVANLLTAAGLSELADKSEDQIVDLVKSELSRRSK